MQLNEQSISAFLEAALDEVFALDNGHIVSSAPLGWIPGVVYQNLPTKGNSTSKEIVRLCRAAGALNETLTLVIEQLRSNWRELKPDRKQNLIALVRNHGLTDHFDPYTLLLSPADEESLQIRWDAADILFTQEKAAIFRRAPIDDKGRSDLLALGTFPEVINILLGLLSHKADYDLSAVLLGVSGRVDRYTSQVAGRCEEEYLGYLILLRDLVKDFGNNIVGVPSWPMW